MFEGSVIEAILQKHQYSMVSTRLDGTQFAVLNSSQNGAPFYDVLVFRESDRKGEALRKEVILLIQILISFQNYLHNFPNQLLPAVNHRTISFLGHKLHILCSDGHPLRCFLHPLVILHHSANTPSQSVRCSNFQVPLIPFNQLDQYLAQKHKPLQSKSLSLDTWLSHLRQSYRRLGIAIFIFPLLMGLALLMANLGLNIFAAFTTIATFLTPLLFILAAIGSFHDFQRGNPYKVRIANENLLSLQLDNPFLELLAEEAPPVEGYPLQQHETPDYYRR